MVSIMSRIITAFQVFILKEANSIPTSLANPSKLGLGTHCRLHKSDGFYNIKHQTELAPMQVV